MGEGVQKGEKEDYFGEKYVGVEASEGAKIIRSYGS